MQKVALKILWSHDQSEKIEFEDLISAGFYWFLSYINCQLLILARNKWFFVLGLFLIEIYEK